MKYALFLMLWISTLASAASPTVKITAPVQSLLIGGTTTVTFVWSESVTDFTLSDITLRGDAQFTTALTGSGTTYQVGVQKLLDHSTISLTIDNNATVPVGHGASIGFNVHPKLYVKEQNAFLGKLVEANPQPRCPLYGEFLADAAGNKVNPPNTKFYTLGFTESSYLSPQDVRLSCPLVQLTGGLQFLKKVAPPSHDLKNVHGGLNHATLMPKITTAQISSTVGTTKVRLRPINHIEPDVNGNFLKKGGGDMRFNQKAAKSEADDPIVFPNEKGGAHLHTFFGNNSVNHQTTTASLIKNCVSTFSGGTANCTGYWMPAVVDTATNIALIPRNILVYYKSGTLKYMKTIESLPQGLKIISGVPSANSVATQTDRHDIECFGHSGQPNSAKSKTFENCSGDKFEMVRITILFPNCVADDGKGGMQLDSPNHRSHLSHDMGGNPQTTFNHCPATHPHRIAGIVQNADYGIPRGSNTATWRLASDNYPTSIKGGFSAHADWWGGWQEYWANRMTKGCGAAIFDCGVDYVGLSDGIGITNISSAANIATVTTQFPHQLRVSNADGTYPIPIGGGSQILRGRLSGVTGASAATYNFDPAKVTQTDVEHPDGFTLTPVGSQSMKIINANTIEITLPATPTTLINGPVDPAVVKLQWGESFCELRGPCDTQAYSDFYYGNKN